MRVLLLAHASTAAVRRAAFPADEPVDAHGRTALRDLGPLPRAGEVVRAPSLRCAQTAEALALDAGVDDRLAGCDFGSWRGRLLDEVAAEHPGDVHAWLADPAACPHGGESLEAFVARIGAWLGGRSDPPRTLLAIVDPVVVQAAIVHLLGAPASGVWRVDVAPLALAALAGGPGRWSLRELRAAGR